MKYIAGHFACHCIDNRHHLGCGLRRRHRPAICEPDHRWFGPREYGNYIWKSLSGVNFGKGAVAIVWSICMKQ